MKYYELLIWLSIVGCRMFFIPLGFNGVYNFTQHIPKKFLQFLLMT